MDIADNGKIKEQLQNYEKKNNRLIPKILHNTVTVNILCCYTSSNPIVLSFYNGAPTPVD
jgi:hypothetical protein